ncbi:heparinase II/III family protein [bacterium]|nr:heparinase II/III family protein [bacterium]
MARALCCLLLMLAVPVCSAEEKQYAIPPAAASRPTPSAAEVAAALGTRLDLTRPENRDLAGLLQKEQATAALSLWRDRVVARLRAHDFGEFGWHDYALHPRSTNSVDYVTGVLSFDEYLKTNMYGLLDIRGLAGPPGQGKLVNWYVSVDDVQDWGAPEIAAWDRSVKAERTDFGTFAFAKSFTGRYWQTGKDVYLQKALELFADFSRNHARGFWEIYFANQGLSDRFIGEKLGVDWRLNTNALQIGWRMKNFLKVLAGLSKCLGPDKPKAWKNVLGPTPAPLTREQLDRISAPELAEIALSLERDHVSKILWFVVRDGAVPNQRAEGMKALAFYAAIFPEFKTTPQVGEYLERAYDNFLTSNFAPDGGSLEQSFNYNGQDKEGLEEVLRFYGDRRPRFADQIEARVAARRAVDDALQTPLGSLPQVGNSLDHPGQPVWQGEAAIARQWELNHGKVRPQRYTSIALPYSGFTAMRSGWGLKGLYLFFMNGRPQSGHSMRDNNAIQVTAYGRQLLVCGGDPTYGVFRTPEAKGADFYLSEASSLKNNTVLVDGRSQSKAGPHASRACRTPIASRWHTSPRCDVVDGLYDLGYGDFQSNRDTNVDKSVQHYRRVIFVRPLKLWLVEDRMVNTGDKPHEYSQVWNFLPYAEDARADRCVWGFRADQFDLQPQAKRFRTTDPGGPNVELVHFGPSIQYRKYCGNRDPWLGWYAFGIGDARPKVDVHVAWQSSDSDTLLTLIVPLDTGEASPVVEPTEDAAGDAHDLKIKLRDGQWLWYRSTPAEGTTPAGAPMGSRAILACEQGRETWGVAFGSQKLSVNGRDYTPPSEDYEYVAPPDGQPVFTPIEAPVVPDLVPPRPFLKIEDADPVTVANLREGLQVRYTTDGRDPDVGSTLYEAPVALKQPGTVKARFFAGKRPLPLVATRDVRPWPWPLRTADRQETQGLEPGLKYDFFVHQSSIRIYDLMLRRPERSGVCAGLDMSLSEPVRFCGVKWRGYVRVPRDGVYHFFLDSPETAALFIQNPERDLQLPVLATVGWWGSQDSGSAALQAGLHMIEIQFMRNSRNELKVEVEGPGVTRQALTDQWFWRER